MPLSDLRIVEVVGGVPAAYCGRLFADLGADVLLAGRPSRPELGGRPDHPLSHGLWSALHRNKRRVACTPGDEDWKGLLAGADMVVVEGGPDVVAELGLGGEIPEHLVVLAISHFGQTGPRSSWSGSDLIDAAYGGGLNQNGEAGRPPLRPPAFVGDHELGVNAAIAGLIALRSSAQTGKGQFVDVSGVDAWATVQTGTAMLEFVFMGRMEQRHGRRFVGRGYPFTVLPSKDGWARLICLMGREWGRAMRMIGDPEWARDPKFANRVVNQEQHADELDQLVGEWLSERTGDEILEEALAYEVAWAPVRTLPQVLDDEQLKHREYFWDADGVRVPGFPARYSRTPAGLRSPAPPIEAAGAADVDFTRTPRALRTARTAAALPLDGIRVLDLAWAWAGALGTAILADFGADIVKIESPTRLDPMRLDRPLIGDKQDYDQGALHHNVNRNKRSIQIDLKDEDGPERIRRLAAASDVFLETMSAGTLARYGLDYESLAAINPQLIYVSITGVGRTGPLNRIRSYAPVVTGLSGIDAMTGYEFESLLGVQHGLADPSTGLHAAFAVLAAINEREQSGQGQHVDLSQLEACVSLLGGHLVALQAGVDLTAPIGNRDLLMAPHGVYPAAGDDKWVAIACAGDDAWQSLRRVMGDPEWARATVLETTAGRIERARWMDERIAEWTRDKDRWQVADMLQGAGVTAAPLLVSEDRLADDHLQARGVFTTVDHPVVGAEIIYGIPWKLQRTPGEIRLPAPMLGGDTQNILREYLGEEFERPMAAPSSTRGGGV